MIFSRRPHHLIILGANFLKVYANPKAAPVEWKFPQEFLTHQEVISSDGLKKALTDFFTQQKINNSALVLLSDDIVFHQQFSPPISEDSDNRLQEFLEGIPFTQEQIASAIVNQNTVSLVMAVNRELPQIVCQALESAGGKCAATVPMMAYGHNLHDTLNSEEIDTLLHDKNTPESADILNPQRKKSNPLVPVLVFIIVVLLLVGTFIFFSSASR